MIGIIGALTEEIKGLTEQLSSLETRQLGGTTFYFGRLHGKDVAVALSGVGKVNAAMTASVMLVAFPSIRAIINIGVAGGVGKMVRHGDLILARAALQHDFTLNSPDSKVGQVAGFDFVEFQSDPYLVETAQLVLREKNLPYHSGIIATGDQFINSKEKAEWLRSEFGAIACDMESAAIAHVCHKMGIKFLSMRAASDNGDDEADDDFLEWLAKAASINIAFISALILSLNPTSL